MNKQEKAVRIITKSMIRLPQKELELIVSIGTEILKKRALENDSVENCLIESD